MKLAIIIGVFLGMGVSLTESRACGTQLINFLNFACGPRGTYQRWRSRLESKYPNIRDRFSRDIQVQIPEYLLSQMVDMFKNSFETTNQASENVTRTKAHIRANKQRSRRKRMTKRSIVQQCCYNHCTLSEVKAKYCASS